MAKNSGKGKDIRAQRDNTKKNIIIEEEEREDI